MRLDESLFKALPWKRKLRQAFLGHNRAIGKFLRQGLNQSTTADGRIVVRFDLTLDGTRQVSAREVGSTVAHSIARKVAAGTADPPTPERLDR